MKIGDFLASAEIFINKYNDMKNAKCEYCYRPISNIKAKEWESPCSLEVRISSDKELNDNCKCFNAIQEIIFLVAFDVPKSKP